MKIKCVSVNYQKTHVYSNFETSGQLTMCSSMVLVCTKVVWHVSMKTRESLDAPPDVVCGRAACVLKWVARKTRNHVYSLVIWEGNYLDSVLQACVFIGFSYNRTNYRNCPTKCTHLELHWRHTPIQGRHPKVTDSHNLHSGDYH